jgi:hypothetical protein
MRCSNLIILLGTRMHNGHVYSEKGILLAFGLIRGQKIPIACHVTSRVQAHADHQVFNLVCFLLPSIRPSSSSLPLEKGAQSLHHSPNWLPTHLRTQQEQTSHIAKTNESSKTHQYIFNVTPSLQSDRTWLPFSSRSPSPRTPLPCATDHSRYP